MKSKHTIKKDGRVVTEVLERAEGEQCSAVRSKVTNALGTELSDEKTGPEGDTVHEVNY